MIVVERAISLTQPWATLMAIDKKRVETRNWRVNFRGWVAIHAAKAFPMECRALCYRPQPFGGIAPNGTPLQLKLRPCGAGVGAKGGKSRGAGSGSRLRKFVCDCGVIARVARDEFHATCSDCSTAFKRVDAAVQS